MVISGFRVLFVSDYYYSYSQLLLLKLGHNPEVVVVVGLMVMGFYSI